MPNTPKPRKLSNPDVDRAKSVFDFSVRNIRNEVVSLEEYRGHVCLFVNVASKSGFTDHNYKVLNALYQTYEPRGFRILAFPCNQFGEEEPGTAAMIAAFAAKRDVRFDLFEKTKVNGEKASPVWKYLKQHMDIGKVAVITTNFTKFLVNKLGQPVARFGPEATEDVLSDAVKSYL